MNLRNSAIVSAAFIFGLVPTTADANIPFGRNTIADVAENVTPAVVSITVQKTSATPSNHPLENHPMFKDFFGPNRGPQRKQSGAGSGVVISSNGYIVTNNHVIDGADKITVNFANQKSYKATLVGTDKPSDIALIKIKGRNFPYLKFADSSKIRLGDFVLAVGNPFGVGQTLTMGIVSAKGRADIGMVDYENFIQTDAAINPGNSGGALVNLDGKLIGINTAILSRSGGSQGIGFSVPSNMIQPILSQIRTHGRVRRGWLGVAIQNLTPDLSEQLGMTETTGVLISDVLDTGPAGKSGLKAGDVIQSVNGKSCRTSAELRNHIALLGPNTKANIKFLRDRKLKTLKVKLGEKEDLNTAQVEPEADESLFSGVTLKKLDRELRNRLEAPLHIKGVVITDLSRDSNGAEIGLRPGDVITAVNRKPVRSVSEIRKLGRKSQKLLLRVWRKGHSSFMVLKR